MLKMPWDLIAKLARMSSKEGEENAGRDAAIAQRQREHSAAQYNAIIAEKARRNAAIEQRWHESAAEYDAIMDQYAPPGFEGYADPYSPRGKRLRAKHAREAKEARQRKRPKH